jgi:hypothetical protein
MFNTLKEGHIRMALLLRLLCTHLDPNASLTMGYVHQVLAGNANLPTLPLHKPIASYSSMNLMCFMIWLIACNKKVPINRSNSMNSRIRKCSHNGSHNLIISSLTWFICNYNMVALVEYQHNISLQLLYLLICGVTISKFLIVLKLVYVLACPFHLFVFILCS